MLKNRLPLWVDCNLSWYLPRRSALREASCWVMNGRFMNISFLPSRIEEMQTSEPSLCSGWNFWIACARSHGRTCLKNSASGRRSIARFGIVSCRSCSSSSCRGSSSEVEDHARADQRCSELHQHRLNPHLDLKFVKHELSLQTLR